MDLKHTDLNYATYINKVKKLINPNNNYDIIQAILILDVILLQMKLRLYYR